MTVSSVSSVTVCSSSEDVQEVHVYSEDEEEEHVYSEDEEDAEEESETTGGLINPH